MMPLTFALSLLCSLACCYIGDKGCKVVAAVLDKTQITSLKCASHPTQCLNCAWTLSMCLHLRQPMTYMRNDCTSSAPSA